MYASLKSLGTPPPNLGKLEGKSGESGRYKPWQAWGHTIGHPTASPPGDEGPGRRVRRPNYSATVRVSWPNRLELDSQELPVTE